MILPFDCNALHRILAKDLTLKMLNWKIWKNWKSDSIVAVVALMRTEVRTPQAKHAHDICQLVKLLFCN